MTEPSPPELEAERDRLYGQLAAVGDFRRESVRPRAKLAQMREAELRVRRPGSSRSRAAVLADPAGGPPEDVAASWLLPRWRRCAGSWPGVASSRRPPSRSRR